MIKCLLDGNEFEDSAIKGLNDAVITLRRNDEQGYISSGYSSSIEFVGEAYDYLKAKLIDDINKYSINVTCTIIDDCCGFERDFIISVKNISFCDNDCTITADLTESDIEIDLYNKISYTEIYDNWNGFQSRIHPRIVYSTELRPQFLSYMVLLIGIWVGKFLDAIIEALELLITPIAKPVNQIIKIINGAKSILSFTDDIKTIDVDQILKDIPVFKQLIDLRDSVYEWVWDEGRTHPAPLVRDYIKNVCDKWNITFSSEIFMVPTSPYYNTVLMFAANKIGIDKDDTTTFFVLKNQELWTLTELLDKLKAVFNAEWTIKGTTLYFNYKQPLNEAEAFIDITALEQKDIIKGTCYSFAGTEQPALLRFKYFTDGVDEISSEAKEWYEQNVYWNPDGNKNQSGIKDVQLEFACNRFRGDENLTGAPVSIFDSTFGKIFRTLSNIGTGKAEGSLLMSTGKSFIPKLLIWDGIDPVYAKVKSIGSISNHTAKFNYDLLAEKLVKNYEIDNPRNKDFKPYTFSVTIPMSCENIKLIDINKPVVISKGVGKVTEIVLGFKNRTIEINGIV